MDKRQLKTLDSIYEGFSRVINMKKYDDITIQDILDEAHIGRSTFYLHFKTKDELLLSVSKKIFDHVFSHSLQEERTHDFSSDKVYDYKHLITHIFYHIKDESSLIRGILKSNCNKIFLDEFKMNLYKLADSYFSNYPLTNRNIPLQLKKDILVNNFIVILEYWMDEDFSDTPETLTSYFITLIN